MQNHLHFISGLPRSGSTLLSALLRQNPRLSAGMSSPVYSLFRAMLSETSARAEGSVFIDNDIRKRLLAAVFDAYYAEAAPETVIFDTNRGWTTKLPALVELFPNARMVCCVRNPASILDSVESLVRRNAYELSGIFNYVRYESLVGNPLGTLAAIYGFIDEKLHPHDPLHIEPCYDMIEFDQRLGTPGLHDVGRAVKARDRKPALPPDLITRYERDAFWEDLKQLPPTVKIV
jgi:sulfotransferase